VTPIRALSIFFFCAFFVVAQAAGPPSKENAMFKYAGLAQTPSMGWNSWNTFACDINEELIRETADAMVASGMRDAGYAYVNTDDCWHGDRERRDSFKPIPNAIDWNGTRLHQRIVP